MDVRVHIVQVEIGKLETYEQITFFINKTFVLGSIVKNIRQRGMNS